MGISWVYLLTIINPIIDPAWWFQPTLENLWVKVSWDIGMMKFQIFYRKVIQNSMVPATTNQMGKYHGINPSPVFQSWEIPGYSMEVAFGKSSNQMDDFPASHVWKPAVTRAQNKAIFRRSSILQAHGWFFAEGVPSQWDEKPTSGLRDNPHSLNQPTPKQPANAF